MRPRRLACAAALAALLVPGPLGGQQPTFRAAVDLVTVDVAVSRGGQPVGNLSLQDFAVFDNGVRQKLEALIVEEVPLEAYLVLDTSASVAGERLARLRDAAALFLRGLTPRDRAGLVTFSCLVLVPQPLTSDLDSISRALASVKASGQTALNDATFAALKLRAPGPTRGVAVVFSDGFDTASWLTNDEVTDSAERSDVVVYGVTLTSPSHSFVARASEEELADRFLRNVAKTTGGRLFHASTAGELATTFGRVLDDIRARYLITYYPSERRNPGWHALEVRLTRAKGEVTARRGYYRQD